MSAFSVDTHRPTDDASTLHCLVHDRLVQQTMGAFFFNGPGRPDGVTDRARPVVEKERLGLARPARAIEKERSH